MLDNFDTHAIVSIVKKPDNQTGENGYVQCSWSGVSDF